MKIQYSRALRDALLMFVATFLSAIVMWFVFKGLIFTFFATPARLNSPAYSSLWRPIVGSLIIGLSVAWMCYHEKWFVDEAPDEPLSEDER